MDQQPTEVKSVKPKRLIIIIALAVIIGGALVAWLLLPKPSPTGGGNVTNEAAKKLYNVLGNVAKQQKIRVAMYRETFANKANADARQQVGSIASSVSEVDVQAGKYRSVFAHNLLEENKTFSIGRCIDGTTYNEVYENPAKNTQRASSLHSVDSQMKLLPEGNLYQVTQPIVFIACPHLGLMPSAPPLAVSRLSDGVIPVTLSDEQANNWAQKVEATDLFEVKDEGVAEKNGQSLRKLSFRPKEESGVNQKLYDIFYEAGEIEKLKTEQPDAKWEFEFLAINPLNTGSVGGYYLIDEKTNLPVYSELYGTNPDKKTNESRSAGQNIARTKQTYTYPDQLTIDINTPLEFLE